MRYTNPWNECQWNLLACKHTMTISFNGVSLHSQPFTFTYSWIIKHSFIKDFFCIPKQLSNIEIHLSFIKLSIELAMDVQHSSQP